MSHQAAEVESWRWRAGKPGGAAVAAKVGVALARVEPALCELEHRTADGPQVELRWPASSPHCASSSTSRPMVLMAVVLEDFKLATAARGARRQGQKRRQGGKYGGKDSQGVKNMGARLMEVRLSKAANR